MALLPLKKRFFCKIAELWLRSLRISFENADSTISSGIIALWHRDLFAATAGFHHRGIAAFISPSADGDVLAQIAKDLGYQVIRGSSNEKSLAIRKILPLLKKGTLCAMVLDGPQGPAEIEKPGTRWLANKAGVPIWKVRIHYGAHISLSSWDKAVIPLPLSKLTMSLSYL